MMRRLLSHEEAKRYYDNYGARQDSQEYYEDKPFEVLSTFADFENASSVMELGVGTGSHASFLLKSRLPGNCSYTGTDISPTMTELARRRLASWSDRVTLRCTDGSMILPDPNESFDRVVSCYVLDLLSDGDIHTFISEAYRTLKAGGLLCLTSLTHGRGPLTAMVSAGWNIVHSIHPARVGGCRPIVLIDYLPTAEWNVHHRSLVSRRGVTSEVIVAVTTRGGRSSGAAF